MAISARGATAGRNSPAGSTRLTRERPVKTVGSYWPYLSTVYDYVHRAMPFGNARSLSNDDVYALTAYVLYLNDIVKDEDFELSNENFTTVEDAECRRLRSGRPGAKSSTTRTMPIPA